MTLVAISGGADSVALLCLLHDRGADIQALHCNFHLRGKESERDERFVTDLCQRMGIPLHIKHFDTREYARQQGISIEMAARELRYEWFEAMRQELGAQDIAVAHHRDDQAETVLLNLLRGTGLRGLAGMHTRHGHIVRPLLDMGRDEILAYLEAKGQNYVTDSSNLERDALRNRIRLDVMPLLQQINPQAVQHIAQAARHVAEALPYYEAGVEQAEHMDGTTLHERLRGKGFTPAQEAEMLVSQRSGACFESETHRATFSRGRLVVEQKTTESPPPQLVTNLISVQDGLQWLGRQPRRTDTVAIDARCASQPLNIRLVRSGDRFRPFGMKRGTQLVNDFLAARGLSVFERRRQWVVTEGENIVWVVGHRIDDRYRITSDTTRVLVIALGKD